MSTLNPKPWFRVVFNMLGLRPENRQAEEEQDGPFAFGGSLWFRAKGVGFSSGVSRV